MEWFPDPPKSRKKERMEFVVGAFALRGELGFVDQIVFIPPLLSLPIKMFCQQKQIPFLEVANFWKSNAIF